MRCKLGSWFWHPIWENETECAMGGKIMKPQMALCLLLAASTLQAAELPIRQIILYKHGIGYFQRSGRLGPSDSAQLDFKAEEMNDVLKSLTIQQSGGGQVTGLRYGSSDPLD